MAEPREEIERLLQYLLPFAEARLNQDGEFRPAVVPTPIPVKLPVSVQETLQVEPLQGHGYRARGGNGLGGSATIPD